MLASIMSRSSNKAGVSISFISTPMNTLLFNFIFPLIFSAFLHITFYLDFGKLKPKCNAKPAFETWINPLLKQGVQDARLAVGNNAVQSDLVGQSTKVKLHIILFYPSCFTVLDSVPISSILISTMSPGANGISLGTMIPVPVDTTVPIGIGLSRQRYSVNSSNLRFS